MPSRRELLGAVGAAAAAGLAGCSGAESDRASVSACATEVVDAGDADVVTTLSASTVDGEASLDVSLSVGSVRDAGVAGVALRNADGDLLTWIPVDPRHVERPPDATGTPPTPEDDDRLRYEYALGQAPRHGRYSAVAVDADRETLDSVTVDVNCFEED
jgi:hypothetical protein